MNVAVASSRIVQSNIDVRRTVQRLRRSGRPQQTAVRAQKLDDNKPITEIDGYKIGESQGILESELFANLLKVGFVALCVSAVVFILNFATPVINSTANSFPKAGQPGAAAIAEDIFGNDNYNGN